mmetsp:Transcript_2169/g.5115  ORF Transcript_2169/g.5115 Transcript_2169/m.5115 type:complete len:135 (-) Transcript_2169:76-480(-)
MRACERLHVLVLRKEKPTRLFTNPSRLQTSGLRAVGLEALQIISSTNRPSQLLRWERSTVQSPEICTSHPDLAGLARPDTTIVAQLWTMDKRRADFVRRRKNLTKIRLLHDQILSHSESSKEDAALGEPSRSKC